MIKKPPRQQKVKVYQLIQMLARYPATWEVWIEAADTGYQLVSQSLDELDDDKALLLFTVPEGD